MKCSLGVSYFLEISSLFYPIFSSISLHWSLRKAFLCLLAILWNSAFKWVYLPFSPLLFPSLLFSAICKASSDNHFAFLHFFFLRMVLITASCKMSRTSVHSSSGTLSTRSSSLKQVFVISVSVGQQFRTGLLGVSGSVSLTRLQWNFWLGYGHLKACLRLEKTFYNCTPGCCLEASIPHHRFFIRAFGVFSRHRSWLSPEGVTQKRASRKLTMPFMS